MGSGEFRKSSVLVLIAMLAVAHDGVTKVSKVQTYLMVTPCVRRALHEGEPGRGIAADGVRQFTFGQWRKRGLCQLGGAGHALGKGFANATRGIDPASHNGHVGFICLLGFELLLTDINRFHVFAKDDHPTGGFVQSMNRIKSPRKMAAQQVLQVLRFVSIYWGFVDQKSSRFGHDQVAIIFMKQPYVTST